MSDQILTAAEVAALRRSMGLTLDQLAAMLEVNPRTVRSWESGRDDLSPSSSQAVWELAQAHAAQVERYARERSVTIPRAFDDDMLPPRGWYLTAAGLALRDDPDVEVDWS